MKQLSLFGAIALACSGTTVAVAMQSVRSAPQVNYHLMQISVETDQISLEDFEAKIETVSSCDDARKLAKTLKADSKRNRFVRGSSLPAALRDELSQLDVGQLTQVFSADASVMRVIVLCGRV